MPSLFSDHMLYSQDTKPAQCLTNGKILLKIIEKNFNVLKNLQSSPTGSPKCTASLTLPSPTHSSLLLHSTSLKSFHVPSFNIPSSSSSMTCMLTDSSPSSQLPNTIGLHKPEAAHPPPGIHAEVRN